MNSERGECRRIRGHMHRVSKPAPAVRFQNFLVAREQAFEFLAGGVGGVARQSIDGHGARLVLQLDLVDFEPGEFPRFLNRGGAGDDIDAEKL